MKEITLTGEYKVSGLISRLEFRTGLLRRGILPDGDGFKKNQSTVTGRPGLRVHVGETVARHGAGTSITATLAVTRTEETH